MCGIFGFVGSNKSKFDYNKFNILGIYNDSRGGDSCGVYMDGFIGKGVGANKLFTNFIIDDKDYIEKRAKKENLQYVLGHCRKASVGYITVDQAQPVIVKDDEDNIELVMIHNGTLLNHKELASKYEVKEGAYGDSDSMLFAQIVAKAGFGVLSEYNGAGAFVFHMPKTGDTYFFQGESKDTPNSKDTKEERPFYLIEQNGGYFFSSIGKILDLINTEKDAKVMGLKTNNLYHIKNGIIKSLTEFDRKDRHQTEPKVYNYNGNGYLRDYDSNDSKIITAPNNNKTAIDQIPPSSFNPIKILNEYKPVGANYRNFYKGHMCDEQGEKITGIFCLERDGKISDPKLNKGKLFYIVNGVIVKDYINYIAALYYKKILKELNNTDIDSFDLISYSCIPVWCEEYESFFADTKDGVEYFNGYFKVPFSFEKEYKIEDAKVTAYGYYHHYNSDKRIYKSFFDEYDNVESCKSFIKLERKKNEKFKKQVKQIVIEKTTLDLVKLFGDNRISNIINSEL